MTDYATVIRTEISRPAAEIVKGLQALATTALSDREKKHRAGVDAALAPRQAITVRARRISVVSATITQRSDGDVMAGTCWAARTWPMATTARRRPT